MGMEWDVMDQKVMLKRGSFELVWNLDVKDGVGR